MWICLRKRDSVTHFSTIALRHICISLSRTDLYTLTIMNNTRVYKMAFASVYPHYIAKAEKKGRTKEELDEIIFWLTGYDRDAFQKALDNKTDLETFYSQAPNYHPNASKITGVICGHRVENIEDPVMKRLRQLDKLVDELAKGRPMSKILRD